MWFILKQIARVGLQAEKAPEPNDAWHTEREQIAADILSILGRALCIRQVDAGSCNACEIEIHALTNPYYNIEGMGIKFVASPRHADMLLVTGPVTKNMEAALKDAYEAVPHPKLVVAVGECAASGGLFGESYASCGRVSNVIPVDVTVPGCPPPPIEILRGILTAVKAQKNSSGK
ncbi:MAG TPA: NADH-quinone oxidoreductase subunit NuoB [Noviherbaspirillum sp.]|uniref:NADH-quinone oxidoreductase subunit B family protein n=1 Tax=Noviherbaspirillum sp. TaxID=1926288 RepID=UPI002B491B17|nr:NADH-quinone oxidoreductase subunit NuoB [Noviherbaspirillum sp.]HJV85530.1 NADH-quinone oxidoreductase subunit NuoB [Noviherbaspirillum sp.]